MSRRIRIIMVAFVIVALLLPGLASTAFADPGGGGWTCTDVTQTFTGLTGSQAKYLESQGFTCTNNGHQ